ncbi:methyltransferase [Nocardia alni]|uniref:methyltransferase n=1 Tax=Nocardia alni TaxID=2815723 RepID=UPI001C22338D|nr:methyltransferase [Nocardia alni]
MSRLSRPAAAAHQEACRLVDLARDLSEDEKQFVLEHYQESMHLDQGTDGMFFIPSALARAMAIHVVGTRIIDLGAGIGHLGFACRNLFGHRHNGDPTPDLVCVEANPDLVRVGMKIVPEAVWVCADMFELPARGLRQFDTAIANPPYGRASRTGSGPGYRGRRFEYHAIALAAQIARHGVFLIPQSSAPFRYSGMPHLAPGPRDEEYERFVARTGILLAPSKGIDTSLCDKDWHHRVPPTEVALADFTDPAVLRPHRRSPVLRALTDPLRSLDS